MTGNKTNSELFREKMQAEGLSQLVTDTFLQYYSQMISGECGYIYEADIKPATKDSLPSYSDLSSFTAAGEKALRQSVIIKLNGGLGTSMGLDGPKCMLPAKNSLSFFDITARQMRTLNKKCDFTIPLVLMNSFRTDAPTRELLKHCPDLKGDIPTTFIQNKYPKIFQESHKPAVWSTDPSHEWNPPGHGDIYTSLVSSGILQKLLDADIKYAFISNIDNMGATMDTSLLGYFASMRLAFMMEAVSRTEMDKKGGHLARLKLNDQLILRELAQTDEQEIPLFQDVKKYCFFNSNNLWINLSCLKETMGKTKTPLSLPLIINKKHLVPSDKKTPAVNQLETAMGSAIALFPESQAVTVPHDRFIAVKKCEDLLLLWSDYYTLNKNFTLILNPERTFPPLAITLDENFYGSYQKMMERFSADTPSLLHCKSLLVEGDVSFGGHITFQGDVIIRNLTQKQVSIPDGTVIKGSVIF